MSKNKIIKVTDGPESLIKAAPALLSKGGVIQITPLLSYEQIQDFVKKLNCEDCNVQKVCLISYKISNKISALFSRCRQCLKPIFIFFSEEKLWSADIIIVKASSKDNRYRKEIRELLCPVCHLKYEILYLQDPKDYNVQQIIPIQLRCQKCQRLLNFIYWDSPKYYFGEAIAFADEASRCSLRAGLVLLVSALETFLQKAFLFQSESNKYLIRRRKVFFQSIEEARETYIKFMKGIDIKDAVDANIWQILTKANQDRNGLIHNAGFDKQFEPIVVSPEELVQLRRSVVSFVSNVGKSLEEKLLI